MNPLKKCASYKRAKTCCPLKNCGKSVYNLPRHMRLIHKWEAAEAKHVKGLYDLRKPYHYSKKKASTQLKKTLTTEKHVLGMDVEL